VNCDCSTYSPIELDRASIKKRIKASKSIKARLETLGTNNEARVTLFRCPHCGQFWQSGHEWNFADAEYLFQVPTIEVAEWLREPYAQPAAMMIYSAVMRDHHARAPYEPTDSPCRAPGCSERATRFSVFCQRHHIADLQRLRRLPQEPVGRLFPPYFIENG